MAAMEYKISLPVMKWIADIKGSSLEDLAEDIAPKKRDKFLDGIVNKTQADKLIKIANIPFGFLFLKSPPLIERPTLPDFRSTVQKEPLSESFFEVIEDIQFKIDWYKDYLEEAGNLTEKEFVGRFDFKKNSSQEVANDIAKEINFSPLNGLNLVKKDNYLKTLVTKFENIGILVFQNGIVKSNTKKPLSVKEFRGFAVTDKHIPAVFINGRDAKSAQIFTLIHEIAHIWIGQEGVSDWSSEQKIEVFCNNVAAHFLMPDEIYINKWQKSFTSLNNIFDLAAYFKVSPLASAIKASQLELIDKGLISEVKNITDKALQEKAQGSGGNPYATIPLRNSRKLTAAVLNQAINQNIMLSDASKLLNIKPKTVMTLYKKQNEKA